MRPGQLVLAPADVQEVGGSSDGRHLAWLSRTAPASRDCAAPRTGEPLGLRVADGSGARRVADVRASTRTPVRSPDGPTVAVLDLGADADPSDGGTSRLVFADAASITVGLPDGTDQHVLALTGTDAQDLAWFPDGSLLAVAGAVVTPGLRVVRASGGRLREVSDTTSLLQAGLAFVP